MRGHECPQRTDGGTVFTGYTGCFRKADHSVYTAVSNQDIMGKAPKKAGPAMATIIDQSDVDAEAFIGPSLADSASSR